MLAEQVQRRGDARAHLQVVVQREVVDGVCVRRAVRGVGRQRRSKIRGGVDLGGRLRGDRGNRWRRHSRRGTDSRVCVCGE